MGGSQTGKEIVEGFLRTKVEKVISWISTLKDISAICAFVDGQPQQEQIQKGEQVSE